MKLSKSIYNILQYFSTIDDMLIYQGKQVLTTKEKNRSGFTEVDVAGFFNKPVVVRSLSKFLRLFTYPKVEKGYAQESLQDWELGDEVNPGESGQDMFIRSPGHLIKVTQGSPSFLVKNAVKMKFDNMKFETSLKFQITQQQYKQIISDCSLLDLDMITFTSVSNSVIRVILRRKDNSTNKDTSTYDIEVDHEHKELSISVWLNTFSLIEATDHQIEFGIYHFEEDDADIPLVKTQSFCDNNYVVKKVILGI